MITVHGREVLNYPRGMREVMRWALRRAELIVAVSPSTLALVHQIRGLEGVRSAVGWNGLSFESGETTSIRPDGPVRVFTLCRLVARKNIALASARSPPRARGLDLELSVAGTGPG